MATSVGGVSRPALPFSRNRTRDQRQWDHATAVGGGANALQTKSSLEVPRSCHTRQCMTPALSHQRMQSRHPIALAEASAAGSLQVSGTPVQGGGALRDPLLLRVARGEDAERVPVWLMRQAGRYMADFRKFSDHIPFRERSETPDIAIELSLQPWKAFRTDAVIMFSDILTILPALGIEFDMVKGKGPVIMNPVRSREDAANMRTLDDPASSLPFIQSILQTLRLEIDTETALIGFVGSPWTLAAYAVEGEGNKNLTHTKRMMFYAPDLLHSVLSSLEDALVTYVEYQIESGAQVVQIFDSWAHHLTPDQFARFSMPYAERVIQRVRARHPLVPIIFHANGGTGKLHKIKAGCTADVIGIDWGSDMAEARALFGNSAVLQGNVDPLALMGPEDVIRQAVQSCLEDARPKSGAQGTKHILNVGHGVVQGTPEDAVKLFCQLARESSLALRM